MGDEHDPQDGTAEPAPPPLSTLFPEITPAEAKTLDGETARLAERRARVMWGYRRGLSMRGIAEEVGCSLGTVANDVHAVLANYRRIAGQSAGEHLADALQRLNHRELDIQAEWEKSKGERVEAHTTRHAGQPAGDRAVVKKKQGYGDPRLGALLLQCWDRRCKLLGLMAAGGEKAEARTGGDGCWRHCWPN